MADDFHCLVPYYGIRLLKPGVISMSRPNVELSNDVREVEEELCRREACAEAVGLSEICPERNGGLQERSQLQGNVIYKFTANSRDIMSLSSDPFHLYRHS